MSIDRETYIGKVYYKQKYIPMDKLLDFYNSIKRQRDKCHEKDIERLDRELNAIKAIFKETAHE